MCVDDQKNDIVKTGAVLFGENRKLSDPAVKILLELLKYSEPLLKSELEDVEIVPYTKAQAFTNIMGLSMYQDVIDTFARTKMARKRKRVKELLQAINPSYEDKKQGMFSKLFGGGK